jgi:hypothetical protein
MSSHVSSLSGYFLARESIRAVPADLAGSVTGIGSLPFTSTEEAIRVVADFCSEAPFWPQLPRLSDREGVIGQGLGVLANLVELRAEGYGYQVKPGRIDSVIEALHSSSGCLTSDNAVGFAAFEEALRRGAFASALALKGQIEGPVTLATYLFYRDRAFLADASLFSAVAFHIAQIACWQVERLKNFGRPVLMFVDEPALCLDDAVCGAIPQERRLSALCAIFENVRSRGALGGLHCCAERPFDRMCAAQPDILSFDAHHGLERFFSNKRALDFVHRGGWVAYGMIPTSSGLKSLQPASIFSRWLAGASIAGDPQALARRAILTATCGLGLLDPSSVGESFQAAHELGALIRRLAADVC